MIAVPPASPALPTESDEVSPAALELVTSFKAWRRKRYEEHCCKTKSLPAIAVYKVALCAMKACCGSKRLTVIFSASFDA